MDTRAFAAPKGLRPRRRVKPAYDDDMDVRCGYKLLSVIAA
jgi:hypothetical protein